MVLIIGGAYQGKTEYAKKTYSLQDADIFTCENMDIDPNARVIRHLERFALACVRAGKEPAEVLNAIDLSDKILICEDISCGVVPMDAVRSTAISPKIVSFCDMPLHWLCGAATQTSPNCAAAAARRAMPSA